MKKHSSIRSLEAKAKKGDIDALFQLAEYYDNGIYVIQDRVQANLYYEKVLAKFENPTIQLSSLKLVDFRLFDKIQIDFANQSNLTAFVGINGAGKTTILDAIAKSLSWIIKSFVSQGGTGDLINLTDINNDSQWDYSSIISEFLVSGNKYSLELSKSKEGSNSKRSGQYQEIKQLAKLYKFADSRNNQFNFPIMAFYSVERALDINNKDTVQFDEITEPKSWNKFSGYQKSLNGSADFKLFFRWFKYLDDVNNSVNRMGSDVSNAIDRLQAELNSDFVKEMEKQENLDDKTKEFLMAFKKDKQNQIIQLQHKITSEPLSKENRIIQCVTRAVSKFMPGFSNLHIQRSPSLDMLIDKNGATLNVLQLSQGEKSLLALVADIARRLVLLNPSLNDPLQGNGIVLIDEIDLHLHPGWQQTIVPNLSKTFSNIQFIFTTHSPQVISTVPSHQIRILNSNRVYSVQSAEPKAQSPRAC